MILKVKNWGQFQHYKDRSPPWIKLHKCLLDDRDFMSLPLASKAIAPLLWLLASEAKDGEFDASTEELMFRLRLPKATIEEGVKHLISKEFFIVASDVLADSQQGARAEGEKEGEGKRETEGKNGYDFSKWPSLPSEEIMKGWFAMRKKKKADVTQIVIDSLGTKLTTAVNAGYSVDECLTEAIERSWTGFNSSWMPEKSNPGRKRNFV